MKTLESTLLGSIVLVFHVRADCELLNENFLFHANRKRRKASMQKRICAGVFALTVIMASAGTARADAILTFAPQMLSTAAGGTVEFDGTLTNTGLADLYLNGDQISFYFSDMTVDDSPFIFNAPLFLSPEGSYTGAFIDVTADAGTPSGSYSGSYTIQGGDDSNTFDDIAAADFTVNVGSITPEPNPFLLVVTGLVFVAIMRWRRTRRCKFILIGK